MVAADEVTHEASPGAKKRRHGIPPSLWLFIITVTFISINVRWIWIYRHGGLHDIDEAGYLSYSVIDYFGLHYGGFRGWIAAIEAPSIQAPLTMALTSLVYAVGGLHVTLGFVVTIGAAVGCIIAAYMLGRSLGSARVGLMAAAITSSCPVIINYARSYQFSTLATLTTSLAVLALLRSSGFRKIGWSLAFGVSLGLMPLARTMLIAFMPGILAAAMLVVLVDPVHRLRRFFMFVGTLVLGALIAATWYIPNGWLVAQYLLNFGYGKQALEYGHQTSKLGFDAWLAMTQAFNREIYTPHLFLFFLGGLSLLWIALCETSKRKLLENVGRFLKSPALPLLIVISEIIVVLTTTSNKGSGFFAPVVPAMATLTGYAFDRLSPRRYFIWITSCVVSIVVLIASVPLVDLRTRFAPEWVADLPLLGSVTVTQGRGTIQWDEANSGYGQPHAVEPINTDSSQEWRRLSSFTASLLGNEIGPDGSVAYGFRNAIYNVNTINLESLLHSQRALSASMIEPTVTGESVSGYLKWLEAVAPSTCALLTSDKVSGDFQPAVNRHMMETAAAEAQFVPSLKWTTPDGQTITLWKPSTKPKNCI